MAKKKSPDGDKDKKSHTKPTREELEKGMNDALEESEAETEDAEADEDSQQEQMDLDTTEQAPPQQDYKKKFVESSKEAMILHHKNKKTMDAIDGAMKIAEPSEQELQKEYSDWDVMSDFEKKMAKESLWNSRRFEELENIQKENQGVEEWVGKVNTFIDDPKSLNDFPELEGKEEEFRLFASRPTRKGSDFDVLVGAFLYENQRTIPPKQNKQMFDTGTGGENTKPKTSTKLSLDESRALMRSDYNKWRQMLQAGRITTDVS